MAIVIVMYKSDGEDVFGEKQVGESMPRNVDLGFFKGDPLEWRRWLQRNNFPTRTKKGLLTAYKVYDWGAVKGQKGKKGGYNELFPGYDENGKKLRPLALYGRIDKDVTGHWGE